VSTIEEEGKDGACDKATKGIPIEGASTPCEGKSAGRRKKIEEDRRRRGSACGQATRSTARDRRGVEKESSACPMTKGTAALWRRYSR